MFFSKRSRTDRYSECVEYLATLNDFSNKAVILSQPQNQSFVEICMLNTSSYKTANVKY